MAGSNITKKALAESMKNLMEEIPFQKITISAICDGRGMNRKSFYYHFKDKYDLVNWIFDTEFMHRYTQIQYDVPLHFFEDLCLYLEKNRSFYRKAFQISGQNAFSDHFVEMLLPIIEQELTPLLGNQMDSFYRTFYSDAILIMIKRWILSADHIPADELIAKTRELFLTSAKIVLDKIE